MGYYLSSGRLFLERTAARRRGLGDMGKRKE